MRTEAESVRIRGLHRRENVGMSSESKVRILATENLRFPEEGSSTQGQSGPKPRTKVVGDGQQAKDSCTTESRLSEVGTQKDRQSMLLVKHVQALRLNRRQIRGSKGWGVMRREI